MTLVIVRNIVFAKGHFPYFCLAKKDFLLVCVYNANP
jgi:hypothetical protein